VGLIFVAGPPKPAAAAAAAPAGEKPAEVAAVAVDDGQKGKSHADFEVEKLEKILALAEKGTES
jgi:hypothetical protein